MKRIATPLLALALALAAGTAPAETVWKWTGPDGKPVFGKQPPKGVKAEAVEVKAANVGSVQPTVPPPARDKGTAGARAATDGKKPTDKKFNPPPVVDVSKVQGASYVKPGDPKYCPPQLAKCRGPGDQPPTPPIPVEPQVPDGKGGYQK